MSDTSEPNPSTGLALPMQQTLFRVLEDLVTSVPSSNERMILKSGSLRIIQKILQHVTINVTQKAIGKSISRWVPVIGPIFVGGYFFLDTRSVGKTAIGTFRCVIEIEAEEQ